MQLISGDHKLERRLHLPQSPFTWHNANLFAMTSWRASAPELDSGASAHWSSFFASRIFGPLRIGLDIFMNRLHNYICTHVPQLKQTWMVLIFKCYSFKWEFDICTHFSLGSYASNWSTVIDFPKRAANTRGSEDPENWKWLLISGLDRDQLHNMNIRFHPVNSLSYDTYLVDDKSIPTFALSW